MAKPVNNIRILVEGGLDAFLLQKMNISKKIIQKTNGFGKIKSKFKSCDEKTFIGIVDEDNGKIINIHFRDLNPQKYRTIDRFEVYKISGCYLIVLHKPEIEDWIAYEVDIKKFGFKSIKDLKKTAKTNKVLSQPDTKIKRLLSEFSKTNSFELLQNFILDIISQ